MWRMWITFYTQISILFLFFSHIYLNFVSLILYHIKKEIFQTTLSKQVLKYKKSIHPFLIYSHIYSKV